MARRVSLTTTDHDTIRRWAEERGGWPAQVASTSRGDEIGIIRIDFPGYTGEGTLERISWDDWFRKFDESNLAFTYEETTAGGQRSSFNKLIGRETAEARAQGRKTSRRAERGAAGATRARRASARGAGEPSRRGASRATTSRGGGARKAGRGARAAGRTGTTRTTRQGAAERGSTGRRQASRAAAARTAGARRGKGGARGGTRRGSAGRSAGARKGEGRRGRTR